MKGPGIRIDLDVRRIWTCPRCSRVTKYLGDVVALRCGCSAEPNWMQLTDLPRRQRAVQQAVVHPAAADEAADAFDEREKEKSDDRKKSPAVEPSASIATTEAPAPESATIEKPGEPVVATAQIEEITVVVTETIAINTPIAPPAPPAITEPPADDFGAGLLD